MGDQVDDQWMKKLMATKHGPVEIKNASFPRNGGSFHDVPLLCKRWPRGSLQDLPTAVEDEDDLSPRQMMSDRLRGSSAITMLDFDFCEMKMLNCWTNGSMMVTSVVVTSVVVTSAVVTTNGGY